ncbi:DUF4238 domain-containing protein [Methanococcoides sp.]|jgi:hypothetical protein|uniref:DUF4238 domain-containing protein n=1 Tax=Methanococcoides sp. TaxID=1966350 RepID=UPI00272E051B|nr:DUF4238 domain-containing protein [Methanococcoides sp.]
MAPKKKQHFIPKHYMRNFSQNNVNLFVFNLKRRRGIRGNISTLCQGHYFYGADLKLENYLSRIEDDQAYLFKDVINYQSLNFLTRDSFNCLRLSLLLQRTRTKAEKNKSNQIFEAFSSKYIKPMMKSDEFLKKCKRTASYIDSCKIKCPDSYKLTMEAALKNVDFIMDLEYVLLINKTSQNFIFGDNPVVFYNYKKIKNNSSIGCKSSGLQIYYPISNKIILALFDNDMYDIKKDTNTTIFVTMEKDVDALNTLQFSNCLDNVYYSEESDIMYVTNLHSKFKNSFEKKEPIIETLDSKELSNNCRSDIDVLYLADTPFKLKLSFIRLNKYASMRYKNSNKVNLNKNPVSVLVRRNTVNKTIRDIIDSNEKRGLV